ncbi:Glycosyl transferase family 2 [Bacteroides faecichinchillae]|uniref:Glycosyl transferase family 2 n=1 Tax=Bacteroides faecichinchillae TaxID=871325 RepID=A0A1M5FVC2_9BACE|nr:glycosyltransferase family 2 protein [Bacteroides faecichinchillae]THG59871.1 glycosyltransferase family 2 protein [Bacteroides faecichinchillae]SHF95500.1 Glycosyl transferase family 2 [Bacteroides faecichinchillae]
MLLSIIIPVYNVEKYIRKTLDSIYSQSFLYEDLEVIVVNDGTPDHSMKIVAEFDKVCSNFHVINQKNKGLSGARNTGLLAAQGKYIWFVDSDDWLEDGCVDKILHLLKSATEDVFVFRIREYDEEGRIIIERRHPYPDGYHCTGKECMLNEKFINTPVQIYVLRRKFLLDNKLDFVEGLIHEDMEFVPRMMIFAQSVVFQPIFSYCYLRRVSGNITSDKTLNPKRLKSLLYIVDRFERLAKHSDDEKARRIFVKHQAGIVLGIYYRVTDDMMENNAEGIMNREYITSCKLIVMHCLRYERNLRHILRDILFLLSVKQYHRIMVRKFMK